jgi:hypothetical protein
MADVFSDGSFSAPKLWQIRGQSLIPSNQGPDGTGTPGSASLKLTSFRIGYAGYGAARRAHQCFLYSYALTNPSQIGQSDGLLASSVGFTDEEGTLGADSFVRKFNFAPDGAPTLVVNLQYFVYFSAPQLAGVAVGGVYTGGVVYDFDLDTEPELTLQFQAEFSYEA